MNTNNVMAAVPQQGAPRSKGIGKAAGTSGSTSRNSFDDALGKLQADTEGANQAKNSGKAGQGREAMTEGGAKDGAPQDPLAAALAASQQNDAVNSQDIKAEAEAEAEVAPASAAVALDLSAAAQAEGTQALQAVQMVQTEEPPVSPPANLQALLPQAEAAGQRQEFQAMMMGEPLPEGRFREVGKTPLQMQIADLGKTVAAGSQELVKGAELQPEGRGLQAFMQGREQGAGLTMPLKPATDGQTMPTGPLQAGPEVIASRSEVVLQNMAETIAAPGAGLQQEGTAGSGIQQAVPQQAMQQVMPRQAVPQQEPGVIGSSGQAAQQAEAAATGLQQVVPQQAAAVQETSRPHDSAISNLLGDAQLTVEEQEITPLRSLHQQEAGGQAFGQDRGQEAAFMDMAEKSGGAVKVPEAAQEAEGASSGTSGVQAQNAGAVPGFQQQVQLASRTAEAQPVPQDAQADFDVPRQIVEQARLIRSGQNTEMVIRLKPEHLGELTLRISVTSTGAVNASFHSDNAQVRAIVENSLVMLRQELNDQGLKVDQVEVFAGLPDGQLPQGQGQQAWQEQQRGNASGNMSRSAEDYLEEAEDLTALAAAAESGAAADSVDYRI